MRTHTCRVLEEILLLLGLNMPTNWLSANETEVHRNWYALSLSSLHAPLWKLFMYFFAISFFATPFLFVIMNKGRKATDVAVDLVANFQFGKLADLMHKPARRL